MEIWNSIVYINYDVDKIFKLTSGATKRDGWVIEPIIDKI